jgi:hypothetical protein
MKDISSISERFQRGDIGDNNEEAQQMKMVEELCKEYTKKTAEQLRTYNIRKDMHADGVVPHSYLTARLSQRGVFKRDRRGLRVALDTTIKALCDGGVLNEMPRQQSAEKYTYRGRCFIVATDAL